MYDTDDATAWRHRARIPYAHLSRWAARAAVFTTAGVGLTILWQCATAGDWPCSVALSLLGCGVAVGGLGICRWCGDTGAVTWRPRSLVGALAAVWAIVILAVVTLWPLRLTVFMYGHELAALAERAAAGGDVTGGRVGPLRLRGAELRGKHPVLWTGMATGGRTGLAFWPGASRDSPDWAWMWWPMSDNWVYVIEE
jgi:hypothetical protein